MNDAVRERWLKRMERAASLLLRHLEDPPTLEQLAHEASVSTFHFHRIWRALTGETVGQTMLRLRLEASQDLLASQSSVTETAMAVGFGTPQSFARAFRRQTGHSPSEYRRSEQHGARDSAPRKIEIGQRGETVVVALRREGKPYNDLNATFAQVWNWAEGAGCSEQLTGIYGIPYDDPQTVPEQELRYDACLALGVIDAPAPFQIVRLPSGAYARLRHSGSYQGLEAQHQWLVGNWLLESGREPADFPVYFQFLNDPDLVSEEQLNTDILLPLAPE